MAKSLVNNGANPVFSPPYLRNTLWELGYAVDTLETALPWNRVMEAAQQIQNSIIQALSAFNERVLVFAHLSHIYRDGASIYVTFIFPRRRDPDETLSHWRAMKASTSETIVAMGGTISHQHGVGLDHAPYLKNEKGALGLSLIRSLAKTLDPEGLLNPGKLIP